MGRLPETARPAHPLKARLKFFSFQADIALAAPCGRSVRYGTVFHHRLLQCAVAHHCWNEGMAMAPGYREDSVNDNDPCNRQAILEMRCPRCLREYRIRRSRIPEGASAVHCKSCGQKIRFPGAAPTARPRRSPGPDLKKPRFRLDLMTPEKRQTKRGFTLIPSRKRRQSG